MQFLLEKINKFSGPKHPAKSYYETIRKKNNSKIKLQEIRKDTERPPK